MNAGLIESLRNILSSNVKVRVWKIYEERRKGVEEIREGFVLEFLSSSGNREQIVVEKVQESKMSISFIKLLGLGIIGLDKENEEELIFLLYVRGSELVCKYVDRVYGGKPTIYTVIDEEKGIRKIRKPILIAEFRLKQLSIQV